MPTILNEYFPLMSRTTLATRKSHCIDATKKVAVFVFSSFQDRCHCLQTTNTWRRCTQCKK